MPSTLNEEDAAELKFFKKTHPTWVKALVRDEARLVLDRLEAELNVQIAASEENLKYHKEKTQNERLIKEWAGGISAMELFVKPIIKAERERYEA